MPARVSRDDAEWSRKLLAILAALGVPEWQRDQLAGISAHESGWYDSALIALRNWAGSKAKQDVAQRYERRTGKPLPWCRTPGHVASGDPDEVRYGAWDSDAGYWTDWLVRHVGSAPGIRPQATIYATAAARFWANDPTWIDALIEAGYRGNTSEPTKRAVAVAAHHSEVARVRRLVGLEHA